jgi:cell division protein FtsQ
MKHLDEENDNSSMRESQKKNSRFESLFFILFLVLIGLIFMNSGIFAVKEFVVRGNQGITTEDILLTSRLDLYKNIFQINPVSIQHELLRNPKIASAKIVRNFPDKIIITVRERQPLCLLLYLGNLLVIGEDAVVMEIKDENAPINLPIVSGVKDKRIKVGEKVPAPEFSTALEILKNADENLRENISEINLANYQLYLDLPNSSRTLKVELGTGSQIEKKMDNLRAVLSQTALENIAKVDLRVPDLPTVIKLENSKSK